jgi:hypothetical protein
MVRDGDHEAKTTQAPWLTGEKSAMTNPAAGQPEESTRGDHHRKSRWLQDDSHRIERLSALNRQSRGRP